MMSLLTLALMVVLVATMRPAGGMRAAKKSGVKNGKGDVTLGPGVKFENRPANPQQPDVVSYALINEKRLPSPAQRAMRRFGRAGSWVYRRFVPLKHDDPTAEGRRAARQSAELQNFLDARNREIARRKSEGDKPGPDDRLH